MTPHQHRLFGKLDLVEKMIQEVIRGISPNADEGSPADVLVKDLNEAEMKVNRAREKFAATQASFYP